MPQSVPSVQEALRSLRLVFWNEACEGRETIADSADKLSHSCA